MQYLTAAQMIDLTRMKALYIHRENNPEIKDIIQVSDNNEKELAEIGQAMIDGDLTTFEKCFHDGKLKVIEGYPVPETNAVYCLFLPPFYVFTDLKKEYK